MKIKAEPSFILTIAILFLTNEAKYALFMLSSALVHELGHILTLRALHIRIVSVTLGLFGGTITREKRLISYPAEAAVALSGGAVNIISAIIFFLILQIRFDADIFFLFLSNCAYALFNLMPISGLDGGTALTALLSMKLELTTAERAGRIVSRLALSALISLSVFLVTRSAYNISLMILSLIFCSQTISGYEFCRRTS